MRFLPAVFLLVIFSYGASAGKANCSSIHLRWPSIVTELNRYRELGFQVRADNNLLEIERSKGKHILFADGEVIENGVLSLGFLTRSVAAPRRIPGFEGRALFDLMVNYFKNDIKAIKGDWISGGDNLKTLNQLTGKGMALEQAVLLTWTGQQSHRHGFTEVEVVEVSGRPGSYLTVVVLFFRR